MDPGEGTRLGGALGETSVRRVAVFIDYWWVYSSARQAFGGAQPPAWFGNVAPGPLAHALVKRPPSSVRRSTRVAAGLHIFIRGYDPEVHRGQQERVDRWLGEGATVHVGPLGGSGEVGASSAAPGHASVSVALSVAVVEALLRGECDTAIVFAGDAALLPLFSRMAGDQVPSGRIELATWVAPDGGVATQLASLPGVWCHRLGEASFKQVTDDRRARGHSGARPGRAGAAGGGAVAAHRERPPSAMATAMAAAGVSGSAAADGGEQLDLLASPADLAVDAGNGAAPVPPQRLTQRLFSRGV